MKRELATDEKAAALVLASPVPMDRHPAAVYLAGLGPGSRRTMGRSLDVIAAELTGGRVADRFGLSWGSIRYQHMKAVRARLAEVYAPKTASKMLSAVRGVLGAAFDLGQMPATAYQRCVRVRGIKAERLLSGRALTAGEVAAMFAACAADATAAGCRDAAVLALLRCGLRRAEVAAAEVADVDLAGGGIRVMGKGGKERQVPFPAGGIDALADWLTLRGDAAGPLFRGVNKGGRLVGAGLTGQAVYGILQRRAREAGVADVRPHDWRRSTIGDLLDAQVDVSTVARIVGHASVNTTVLYDRRPEAVKREAMSRLLIPYRRRTLAGI